MEAGHLKKGVGLLPKAGQHIRQVKMRKNEITELNGDIVKKVEIN